MNKKEDCGSTHRPEVYMLLELPPEQFWLYLSTNRHT